MWSCSLSGRQTHAKAPSSNEFVETMISDHTVRLFQYSYVTYPSSTFSIQHFDVIFIVSRLCQCVGVGEMVNVTYRTLGCMYSQIGGFQIC